MEVLSQRQAACIKNCLHYNPARVFYPAIEHIDPAGDGKGKALRFWREFDMSKKEVQEVNLNDINSFDDFAMTCFL